MKKKNIKELVTKDYIDVDEVEVNSKWAINDKGAFKAILTLLGKKGVRFNPALHVLRVAITLSNGNLFVALNNPESEEGDIVANTAGKETPDYNRTVNLLHLLGVNELDRYLNK